LNQCGFPNFSIFQCRHHHHLIIFISYTMQWSSSLIFNETLTQKIKNKMFLHKITVVRVSTSLFYYYKLIFANIQKKKILAQHLYIELKKQIFYFIARVELWVMSNNIYILSKQKMFRPGWKYTLYKYFCTKRLVC